MNRTTTILILALAALLEAGGDAIVRLGLQNQSFPARVGWLLTGAAVLFAYGWTVNAPSWDFGRLIGLYVVFFFVAAQLTSWLVFGQLPSPAVLAGGALVVSGGVVIALASA